MKKAVPVICFVSLLFFIALPLFAGGIVNKQNQSADYLRTLNRHAATDYADIAVYNPAGIMKMENGAYAKLDIMYFAKDYSNTVPYGFGGFSQAFGRLSSDEPSIIPGLFAVLKEDRWGAFFALTIPAGGGELDYDRGDARTLLLSSGIASSPLVPSGVYDMISNHSLEVKQSSVLGFTLGGSVAITKRLSIAAGIRYADGIREFDGETVLSNSAGFAPDLAARLNIEQEDDGWCQFIGLNYAPNTKLNAAVTYFTKTKMEYENSVKTDTLGLAPIIGFADGSKTRIDIPALLGCGVSYKLLPELKVDVNYVHYFESNATNDTFAGEDDGYDMGISLEYTFSSQLKGSLGYMHTSVNLATNQQINEPEEPKLSANTVSTGAVWSYSPAFDVTFGAMVVAYDDVKDSLGITYDKEVWNVSMGAQWKFK